MTVQCCKCKLIRRDGKWVNEEPADAAHVTHTYCPFCFDQTMTEMEAMRAATHNAQTTQVAVAAVFERLRAKLAPKPRNV